MTGTMDGAHAGGFGRMLMVSLALHVVGAGVLAIGQLVSPRPFLAAHPVIAVKMVTTARAEPRPAPKPPPPPPEAKIVIPEEAGPLREKEPEPELQPEEPPPQETEPEPEYDLGSALDALRSELGVPDPEAEPIDAEPDAMQGGGNLVADPQLVRWVSQVKRRVRGAWVLAPGFHTQSLYTEVEVLLAANGNVIGVEIVRRSGNPWYDQSVERALHRASPLPAPPEAGTWPFSFTPADAH